jgi:hypothetical protein
VSQAEIDEIEKPVKVKAESQPTLFEAEETHRDDG